MTRIAAVAMGFVGVCSNVFGAVVIFSPDRLEVPVGTGVVNVMVEFAPDPLSTGLSLDAFDMLIGSDRVPLMDFVFSDRILDPNQMIGFANRNVTLMPGAGDYTHDIYVSASRMDPNDPTIPNLPVGMLSLDLTGLAEGLYSVEVNPARDFDLSATLREGTPDPLMGSLGITIVPEPASISLLALGALAALRFGRRRPVR